MDWMLCVCLGRVLGEGCERDDYRQCQLQPTFYEFLEDDKRRWTSSMYNQGGLLVNNTENKQQTHLGGSAVYPHTNTGIHMDNNYTIALPVSWWSGPPAQTL